QACGGGAGAGTGRRHAAARWGRLMATRIVTSRFDVPESWTLRAYLETGGYEGLRKALTMAPEEVAEQVGTASLLGRGGAGVDAARKGSMLRKAEPGYPGVNADESDTATVTA